MQGLIDVAGPDPRLGPLLRRCRVRIEARRTALGDFERLPVRVGKPVTQEEVAEAVGITRQWYARLERDRAPRISAALVARLADALLMVDDERALLFRLALPELRSAALTDRSSAMVEAFTSFRALVRRLWAASTESEALSIAREHALSLLPADAVLTSSRVGDAFELSATYSRGRELSELEREHLRTVADLTSLALAGGERRAALMSTAA